jgi:multidrug efflux pump subunit AcrA (membrane-fusion protein)
MIREALMGAVLAALSFLPAYAEEQSVAELMVDDHKAVIATVEPVHELMARARIGGTITELTVKEGEHVAADDRVAIVLDQKLLLQMQALASRIQAQQAERDQAQLDLGRAQELRQRGAGTQVALDQAKPGSTSPSGRRRRCAPIARSSSSRPPRARCSPRARAAS